MRPHLPPLNALKAFEAAARHESFTRAAEELCVTQGAVSHQVKALEPDYRVVTWDERAGTISTLYAMHWTALPSAPSGFCSGKTRAFLP